MQLIKLNMTLINIMVEITLIIVIILKILKSSAVQLDLNTHYFGLCVNMTCEHMAVPLCQPRYAAYSSDQTMLTMC